ncbi:hypothetical protein, partial [Leadbetterella byssophila]|uniref:hypothetical protein n=1 Tax=Leadbetterella byssophila TaxID=316068 RepID=UPI0039A062B2
RKKYQKRKIKDFYNNSNSFILLLSIYINTVQALGGTTVRKKQFFFFFIDITIRLLAITR